jgi:hypothetical protein
MYWQQGQQGLHGATEKRIAQPALVSHLINGHAGKERKEDTQ